MFLLVSLLQPPGFDSIINEQASVDHEEVIQPLNLASWRRKTSKTGSIVAFEDQDLTPPPGQCLATLTLQLQENVFKTKKLILNYFPA